MKSEGVKDILVWLETKCKTLKSELEDRKEKRSIFTDCCFIDRAEARLDEAVSIKKGVEKYMKKLKHQGE